MSWKIATMTRGDSFKDDITPLGSETCHRFEISIDPYNGVCFGFRPALDAYWYVGYQSVLEEEYSAFKIKEKNVSKNHNFKVPLQ